MYRSLFGAAAMAAALMMSSGCPDSEAVPPTYDSVLDAASKGRQAATLSTLEALVNMESGPGDAVGIQQMSDHLAQQLADLGATVPRHQPEYGSVGENIVGRFEGNGQPEQSC